jgi:16S rRNA (cytidine1402-2'-O)-methyltransferase
MSKATSAKGSLYLIPSPLIPGAIQTLSVEAVTIIHSTFYFIAENARTARRFIKETGPPYAIEELHISELDKHQEQDIGMLIEPAMKGHNIGLLSEAGCPAVADPGNLVVAYAHQNDIQVIPLAGPSSVIMALMSSGLNGQRFQFHGYLSPEKSQLVQDLKRLEEISRRDQATQIFIETPYRNKQIIEAALRTLSNQTQLHIAADITSSNAFLLTMSVREWKSYPIPDLHKRPTVFCLMAG